MNAPNFGQIELSVVLYQEDGHWIAQGLEFDITAAGKSPTDASEKFASKVGAELVMSIELNDEKALSGIGSAPKKFWDMYQSAKMHVETDETPMRITQAGAAPRFRPRMRISDELQAA